MSRPRLGFPRVFGLAVLVLLTGGLSAARAGDYDGEDFSVRMAPAFVRFTEVSTFGGETVANRSSSAINPAALGWMRLLEGQKVVIAPYYSRIAFQEGTRLNIFGESLTWVTGEWGAIQPVLSQIRSNETEDRNGYAFEYRVDTGQVQWGERFGDFALGLTLNYNEVELDQAGPLLLGPPVAPAPVRGTADTRGLAVNYRVRVGGLFEPAEKWLLGLIVEYGHSPYRARTEISMPTPVGVMTLPPVRNHGTQKQILVRPGVSYEYEELSTVYFDYAYGSFFGDAGYGMNHRFSAGVDHRVLEWLWARGTVGIDTRGFVSGGVGVGAYFSRWGSLDIGYRMNTLPELRPEFGRSQTLQLTLSVRF